MSPVLQAILAQSYTANDLHRRLRALQESLEKVLYEEPQQMRVVPLAKRREKAINEVSNETDASILLALPEKVWEHFTPATLADKMKKIYTESDALPVMTLYIPVAFTDVQLAPLAVWARREVAPGLLFEVMVDPKVVGGCAFVYKNTHFDWSLRRYLRAKRGIVTSLLNAYGE